MSSLPIDSGSVTIGRRMIRGAGALERKATMGATASLSGCVERPLPRSPDRWSSGRLGSTAVRRSTYCNVGFGPRCAQRGQAAPGQLLLIDPPSDGWRYYLSVAVSGTASSFPRSSPCLPPSLPRWSVRLFRQDAVLEIPRSRHCRRSRSPDERHRDLHRETARRLPECR